jgi:hypothetical protein
MAAWVGGAASLAMLLSVGELMSKLHSVDLRQSVADFLNTQGTTLNLDLDQALLIARIGLLVTGAASAATLVFAVFAVRRDKSARIAMSVLAVPLLVCGVFVDPFLAGFIVAAAVLLWTRPAADWYAGRPPRPEAPASTPAAGTRQRPNPFEQPPQGPPVQAPPPTAPAPYGSTYGAPTTAPLPQQQTGAYQQPGPYPGVAPAARRPRQVVTACTIAWGTSAIVAAMMVGTLLALQSDSLVQDMHTRIGNNRALAQSGMTFDQLVMAVRVAVVLVMLWAVAAMVVAVFAFRGQSWARIVLAVSAVAAALLGLLCGITFPGFFLVSVAAVASVALLFNKESSLWYAGPRDQGPPPPPPAQPW